MNQLTFLILIFTASFCSFASEILWREDNKASAHCTKKTESICAVTVGNVTTDVSLIENKNIGKLGTASKSQYYKVITFPSKWQSTNKSGDLIIFTTQAWLKKQRYTIKGSVFIDTNGKYVDQ